MRPLCLFLRLKDCHKWFAIFRPKVFLGFEDRCLGSALTEVLGLRAAAHSLMAGGLLATGFGAVFPQLY